MRYVHRNPPTVQAADVRELIDQAKRDLAGLPDWVADAHHRGHIDFTVDSIILPRAAMTARPGQMVLMHTNGFLFPMDIDRFNAEYRPAEDGA